MSSKNAVLVSARQSTTASSSKRRQPTNEEIAARAYEIFLRRGASPGSDEADWLQAERELLENN